MCRPDEGTQNGRVLVCFELISILEVFILLFLLMPSSLAPGTGDRRSAKYLHGRPAEVSAKAISRAVCAFFACQWLDRGASSNLLPEDWAQRRFKTCISAFVKNKAEGRGKPLASSFNEQGNITHK